MAEDNRVSILLAAITEGYGGMYDDVPSALEEIAYGLEAVGADAYVEILRLAAARLRDAVREVSP